MDKNDILAKSRKENEGQDEWERTIRIEGESFSLSCTFLIGFIIAFYNNMHGLSSDIVMIMFWTSCASRQLYKLTKRRELWDFISMIFSLALLVWYMVRYFTQG